MRIGSFSALICAILLLLCSSQAIASKKKSSSHGYREPADHKKRKSRAGPADDVLFDETAVYISSGTLHPDSAIIWYRCPTGFSGTPKVKLATQTSKHWSSAPKVSATSDFTGKFHAQRLEPGTEYHYRVKCGGARSASGTFKTPPEAHVASAVKFAWVADIAGQGYGRNDGLDVKGNKGGFLFAEAVAKEAPDFVLLQGDIIYADGPIDDVAPLPAELNGTALDTVVAAVGAEEFVNTYTKNFTAVTVDEFRKNWQYTFGDAKFARLLTKQPIIIGWDDHEVTNNWYPGEIVDDPKYGGEVAADDLAAVARQALYEYYPIPDDEPIYRKLSYGKHLDVFVADMRSYRDANPGNNEATGDLLGAAQEAWLTVGLKRSTATWKVVALDGPVSIVVGGEDDWDAWAQGDDGAPRGREVQLARIMRAAKAAGVSGIHVITSDVHYQGVINYSPKQAAFKHFDAFSEIIIGPCHAGAFGPSDDGVLDGTFGGEYEWSRGPLSVEWNPFGVQNLPPPLVSARIYAVLARLGFGVAEVSEAGSLTFKIVDLDGSVLYSKSFDKP